jgi:hypothetical protein
MSTIINARSPYFIKYTPPAGFLNNVQLEIYIWDGDKNSPPTDVTYTLNKLAKDNSVGNNVTFEISELIRDYLLTEYYTEAVDAVWVKVDATLTYVNNLPLTTTETFTYLALDGFGYFEDGSNPRTSISPAASSFTPMVLQSNLCVQFVRGREIKIPIFSETEPTITTNIPNDVWNFTEEFWATADVNWDETNVTQNITDSDDSGDKIQYLIISTTNALTGNTITVTSTTGLAQSVTITIEEICEERFDRIRGIFYNKFGALQTMWLTKKSTIKTNVKAENFKRNTIDFTTSPPSYSIYKHNKKRFNVQASQSIETNTTLLNECLNEPIEQLLMSEQVWLENDALETSPVNLTTNSIVRKTGVNDKAMIQYGLNFDYAFEKINSVR